MRVAMAIEFFMIHNVVRTYQRAIQLFPSTRWDGEGVEYREENRTSLSPDAEVPKEVI